MTWIIVGRVIQGMGGVSSAMISFIADLTSEENRMKAMAMVRGRIGISFAVSIVGAPMVFQRVGMSGLALIGVFSMLAVGVVLLRLNFGVLVLHATQTALLLVCRTFSSRTACRSAHTG